MKIILYFGLSLSPQGKKILTCDGQMQETVIPEKFIHEDPLFKCGGRKWGCQTVKFVRVSFHRDGRPLTDDEVAGMLIGLLLAGQHTSSTTSAWMGFFLARDKILQEKCYLEQKTVCGEDLPPLTFDQVCWILVSLLCFMILSI